MINSPNEKRGIRNIFRSFRYRNFRLFFSGQSLSLVGTWIQRIAVPWLVYDLTGSAFLLGAVGFAGQIPTMLITPFAGVLVDRWNRYRILLFTQILSMVQAFVLAILTLSGTLAIWHIFLLSIFLGCINAFDMPARQSFLVDMVDRKEDLGNAIALNSSIVNAARILGPSIAGMLIAFTGEGICFLINGISYLFVIASLLFMKVNPRRTKPGNKDLFGELKEGFAYVTGFLPMKTIILLLAVVSLAGMPYSVLMPVMASEVLGGTSSTFGFLMGASGAGAFAGAIVLASRKSSQGLQRLIPVATTLFGSGLIALSLSRLFPLSMFFMILTGMGMMLQMATSNTMLQTLTSDDKRGRVMSFYTLSFMGTAPFGSLMAGSFAKWIGAPHTILAGGIACLLGAFFFYRKLPRIEKSISRNTSVE